MPSSQVWRYSTSSEALKTKTSRLKEKIAMLKEQMQREILKVQMLAAPDQQISLTDPDARSMGQRARRLQRPGCRGHRASSDRHA
jgi:hypothetical protein